MSERRGTPPAPVRIAVAQPAIAPYDVTANVTAHVAVVLANRADVVVFPEMSLTGYHLDAAPVSVDDPALAPLVSACRRTGTTALVGAPVRDGAEFIAVLAVDGDGVTVAYRKMWLGDEEAGRFTAGAVPAVVQVADGASAFRVRVFRPCKSQPGPDDADCVPGSPAATVRPRHSSSGPACAMQTAGSGSRSSSA